MARRPFSKAPLCTATREEEEEEEEEGAGVCKLVAIGPRGLSRPDAGNARLEYTISLEDLPLSTENAFSPMTETHRRVFLYASYESDRSASSMQRRGGSSPGDSTSVRSSGRLEIAGAKIGLGFSDERES
ncbi:hypothetical protein KM043_003063 [Ampulex compressa]|nr:hypothetical protein KM043_003063 [Ampulex compressa]